MDDQGRKDGAGGLLQNGGKPDGRPIMDRRLLLGALAGSGVTAAGLMAAPRLPAQPDDMVIMARRILAVLAGENSADHLRALGRPIPVIVGLSRPDVEASNNSARGRITASSARLEPGSYLVDNEAGTLDARVDVQDGERSKRSYVRFTFDRRAGGKLRILTVVFAEKAKTDIVMSVASFGVMGAPGLDVSRQVQDAYDRLAAAGGGTLFFPAGDYTIQLQLKSRNVAIAGEGMGSTRLRPARPDAPVIEALYNSGAWTTVTISDLAIVGPGNGTGFRAGSAKYQPGDEYCGRTAFRGVMFDGFERCIDRPAGQIGLWLEGCVFEAAQFHISATGHEGPGDPMHVGNMIVRESHFQGANTASVQLSSTVTGSGQIVFDNCIFEGNPGYVLLVDQLNNTDATPSMVLRSCWNENNATAEEVVVANSRAKPVFAAMFNTGMVRFDDTPLGSLRLRSATVTTQNCPLDRLTIETDSASSVEHYAARGFGSYQPAGLVRSLAAAYQFLPNRNLFFSMPVRRTGTAPEDGLSLISQRQGNISMVDVATGRPAMLSASGWNVDRGRRVRLAAEANAPSNSWLVWLFQYRRTSGQPLFLSLAGGYGIGSASLVDQEARCLAGMTWLPDGAKALSFYLDALEGPGAASIELVNLIAFNCRQRAVDFINSGVAHVA